MAQTRIETIILRNLIYNEDFSRRVLPYFKPEYFRNTHEKSILKYILDYAAKFKKQPTIDAIAVAAENDNLVEETYKELVEALDEIESGADDPVDQAWLDEQAEAWCKDKAMSCAAFSAVAILEGKDKQRDRGAIPQIFEDALAVSFDPSIGHDYVDDAEIRYDILHASTHKTPFDIDICNKATKGGVEPKTLNILAGGVYAGKTLGLCHMAASYLKAGKNVLYITLEIPEEKIGFRIDCNLLDISVDDVDAIPKPIFLKKIARAKEKILGKLKIKEYPAGSVHVNNFRALLHELQLKQHFKPDVIMVDYLGLMASCRYKASDKTHITLMAVAEELRALGQEYGVPIWTGAQLDAEGMNSSDPSMTNLAGSKVGLPATCDLMWTVVVNDKLKELGQALIVQQKNRYKDITDMKRFYIGIDRKKFRWHNVEQKAQTATNDPLGEDAFPDDEEAVKKAVSKKYGQQAYESAYKNNPQIRKFGNRGDKPKNKFDGFQV